MKTIKSNTHLDFLRSTSVKQDIDTPVAYNTPVIFKKKLNKLIFKPLEYVTNDTGLMRHYPPGAQE